MCATNAGIRIASKLYHREHIITVDRNSMLWLHHLRNVMCLLKDRSTSVQREVNIIFLYYKVELL